MSKHKKAKKKRRHLGLSFRAFIIITFATLLIGGAVILFGSIVFYETFFYDVQSHSCKLCMAELASLDIDEVIDKTREILKVYADLPDETKDSGHSDVYDDEYKELFAPLMDDRFYEIKQQMWDTQGMLGLRNAFIVAMDENTNRMIYLIDSDMREKSFCWPGTWDEYKDEEVDILIHGDTVSNIQKRLGLTEGYQATITDLEQFGLRCTAAVTLYQEDGYVVILCTDETLDYMDTITRFFISRFAVALMIIIALATLIANILIRRGIIRPITALAKAAHDYSEDKKSGIAAPNRFSRLEINTHDEFEDLADAMKEMEQSLITYEDNLRVVTAEHERIATELDLGMRIQRDMLPAIFPAFPDQDIFDIYASMDPAKEVGGDFYDYFMIDDDHLGFLIADVSGKGIPAALFMMVSKTVLDNALRTNTSPAEALAFSNNSICSNNKEEMFVTAWLGILELSTGKITASNAGHEKPVIITGDGQVTVVDDPHGFVLGAMDGMVYKDYELQLAPGDKIFVFTDGVTEATASNNELFGMDRLVEALGEDPDADPEHVLKDVRMAVDDFVGDAEQFDDLTMLCLQLLDRSDE